jgi:putative tryptophan/tyrosine transport system substrate-binding protein
MKRREIFTLIAALVAWPLAGRAQQSAKVARIGFLGPGSASKLAGSIEIMRSGLRDLGYVEGKNITIEFRWAEGNYDRLPELAEELVRLNVDVLVTYAVPGALAAKQATTTIPIVVALSAEAVRLGLVARLSRPGGNITGQTFFNPEINAKRLELLKEALPGSKRVAVLFNPKNQIVPSVLEAMDLAARSLHLKLDQFAAGRSDELPGVFSAMAIKGAEALVVVDDPITFEMLGSIVELATARRLPSIGQLELAEAGGLP